MSGALGWRQTCALATLVGLTTTASSWFASTWLAVHTYLPASAAAGEGTYGRPRSGSEAARADDEAQHRLLARLALALDGLQNASGPRTVAGAGRASSSPGFEELANRVDSLRRAVEALAAKPAQGADQEVMGTGRRRRPVGYMAEPSEVQEVDLATLQGLISQSGKLEKLRGALLATTKSKGNAPPKLTAEKAAPLLENIDEIRNSIRWAIEADVPVPSAHTCGKVAIATEENATYKGRFRLLTEAQRCAISCRLRRGAPLGATAAGLARRTAFPTCAVVSSSGLMRTHEFGKDIDNKSAVMRFNRAPVLFESTARGLFSEPKKEEVEEYARMVGTKETVRIFNEKAVAWGFSNLRPGTFTKDFTILIDGGDVSGGSIVPLPNVNENLRRVLESVFPNAAGTDFIRTDHSLTTGFVGVVFMLHVCDSVTLYEMVPSSLSDTGPGWHYYEQGGLASANPWHNSIPYEAAFWRALAVEDTAQTGKLVLNGLRRQEDLCRNLPGGKAPAPPWAQWGYRTQGSAINPVPQMWVPPPGG